MKRKQKSPEHICKFCQIYNAAEQTCPVRLLINGEVFRDIPVDPKDHCIWEEMGLDQHIKQTRFRVVDPITGEPTTGNGKVVIEYDKDFFGSRQQ